MVVIFQLGVILGGTLSTPNSKLVASLQDFQYFITLSKPTIIKKKKTLTNMTPYPNSPSISSSKVNVKCQHQGGERKKERKKEKKKKKKKKKISGGSWRLLSECRCCCCCCCCCIISSSPIVWFFNGSSLPS